MTSAVLEDHRPDEDGYCAACESWFSAPGCDTFQLVAQREAALALHLRPHRCHDERGWLFWFDAERLCLTARALGVS